MKYFQTIQILPQQPKYTFRLSKMGNKRNRRSRRLATPSPNRELSETQVETPNPGNETLTNFNVNVQEGLDENSSLNQLTEPSLLNSEIQVWTQIMEQKNDGKIEKM